MDVHHIAYAVREIGPAARAFGALGFEEESGVVLDERRGVRIQFLRQPGGLRVELVAPAAEGSPVSEILGRGRGAGTPYHVCYEVDDIDGALARLRAGGFVQMGRKGPAPAIEGRDVAFAFSMAAGLIELVER